MMLDINIIHMAWLMFEGPQGMLLDGKFDVSMQSML